MNRRSFLGLLAAPAIIRVADLMPIKAPRIITKSPLLGRPYGMVQFVGNPGISTYEEYTREIVARIARGYGITYHELTGDYHAQDGFSSSRDGNPWGGGIGGGGRHEEIFRRLGLTAENA